MDKDRDKFRLAYYDILNSDSGIYYESAWGSCNPPYLFNIGDRFVFESRGGTICDYNHTCAMAALRHGLYIVTGIDYIELNELGPGPWWEIKWEKKLTAYDEIMGFRCR